MANLQEIARLVREELLTLIQPVRLMTVNPDRGTGEVSGRFRSNGVLFDYSIGSGSVTYRPVGAGGDRADSAAGIRRDANGAARKCQTGYSCGNSCIPKGKKCRKQPGAAAKEVLAIVKVSGPGQAAGKGKAKGAGKAAPAAKGAVKGPSLKEVKAAIVKDFGVKSVRALKADKTFQMAMAGEDNPLSSHEDWLKVYRRFIGVPKNERNQPDGPTVINGLDVTKHFRPWHTFGLDPKTATVSDINQAYRRLMKKHHPDMGGDPRVAERLTQMRKSLIALHPETEAKSKGRRDSADRRLWTQARWDGYQEVMTAAARSDASGAKKKIVNVAMDAARPVFS